jgi:hypothetical protein
VQLILSTNEGKDCFATIAKLRSHLQCLQDFTGIWISFSNEKGVSRVHGPVDRYLGWSMVDSRSEQGSTLTGAWRATATEGGSSPWEHLEEEGAEGILTTASVGDGAMWFGRASTVRSGDAWSLLRQP